MLDKDVQEEIRSVGRILGMVWFRYVHMYTYSMYLYMCMAQSENISL